MTRWEYTEQVLANLRRVTKAEREAVRAEIDGHMEDHICDLLDLGYPPELAEERTLSFMGDPAEVGRELNKQYPFRWLVTKWIAVALTLAFVLAMLVPAWRLAGTVSDNLWNRFYPLHQMDLCDVSLHDRAHGEYCFLEDAAEVDLRQTRDGVTMRVYQAGLKCPMAPKKTEAWVAVCLYSENPFYQVPQVMGDLTDVRGVLSAPLGQDVSCTDYSGVKTAFTVHGLVRRGEELEFTFEQYGHRFSFSVPLPWEEP